MPSIAITGIGLISALGPDVASNWRGILAERSGLGPLGLFASPRCGHFPVGEVREADLPVHEGASRSDRLALKAADEALRSSGLSAEEIQSSMGIVLGASTGGMLDSEAFVEAVFQHPDAEPPFRRLARHEPCASTEALARHWHMRGPRTSVSVACASGAAAVATAADWIREGLVSVALAGGVDSLTRLTLNGFASLLAMDPEGCRPFDAQRAGMSLGEGAAFIVLESLDRAAARGAPRRGLLLGTGQSCDAHHETAPHPEGRGILAAMRAALAEAAVNPEDIGYVNAHGTGTRENDPVEGRALMALFDGHPPPVSSTKRFFGHTLAAAGAIEAAVTLLALEKGMLPANLGLKSPDPDLGFEPIPATRASAARFALSLSLGFGGNNAALLLGSWK